MIFTFVLIRVESNWLLGTILQKRKLLFVSNGIKLHSIQTADHSWWKNSEHNSDYGLLLDVYFCLINNQPFLHVKQLILLIMKNWRIFVIFVNIAIA